MGIFGELGVMGTVIGIVIGILAGYHYTAVVNLGVQIGVLMVFLPKTVSVLCEGIIPIANAITEFVQERFEEEVYIGRGLSSFIRTSVGNGICSLLYPLIVILAVLLPGNAMLPIASLAVIPYWCSAVAAQLRKCISYCTVFVLI